MQKDISMKSHDPQLFHKVFSAGVYRHNMLKKQERISSAENTTRNIRALRKKKFLIDYSSQLQALL